MHANIDVILCVNCIFIGFTIICNVGFGEWYLEQLVSGRHLAQTKKTGKSLQKCIPLLPCSKLIVVILPSGISPGCRTAFRVLSLPDLRLLALGSRAI
jgi:hypothetical protein